MIYQLFMFVCFVYSLNITIDLDFNFLILIKTQLPLDSFASPQSRALFPGKNSTSGFADEVLELKLWIGGILVVEMEDLGALSYLLYALLAILLKRYDAGLCGIIRSGRAFDNF